MDHRLAKLFGGGFAAVAPRSDVVGGPIVLHDRWMVGRNVGDPLIEVFHRIAAVAHDARHELVGLHDCSFGLIDKTRLDGSPFLGVPFTRSSRAFFDMESAHASSPLRDVPFSRSTIA